MVPRDSTTGDSVQYAPPSITNSMSIASSLPSRRSRSDAASATGCRLVVATMSSSAVVDHLHRPAGLPREQRRVAGDDRRVLFLAAEAAAGLHLDDADALGRQVEQRRRARGECSRDTASSPTPSRRARDRRRRACRSARCRAAPARRSRTRPRRSAPRRPTPLHVAARDEIRLEDVVAAPDRRGARSSESSMVKTGGSGSTSIAHAAARLFEQVAIGVREEHDRLFGMIDASRRPGRADRR